MRIVRFLMLMVGLVALQAAPAHAAMQTLTIANMTVSVWLPDRASESKDGPPVLFFSHDFHGCATQSAFLMEAFASAGYAVFAPNHHDAACDSFFKRLLSPDVAFAKPDDWTDHVYIDRVEDLRKLLDALLRDKSYSTLDWGHIGVMGVGLGGYTALSVVGAWPELKDERIKAVLALSPYTAPFVLHRTFKKVVVPVMYEAGGDDQEFTPWIEKNEGAYELTLPPKIFIKFNGVNRNAWSDMYSGARLNIENYSVGFFDHYLKNQSLSEKFTNEQGGAVKIWTDIKR